jgi:Leucine-rich repeat (LRR) protein
MYNNLSFINETVFYGLRNLLAVDLSNNKLTDFPQFATKNITILSLQDNRIQRIEKHHIEGFTRLLDLHLGGNRISYIENYTFVDACHLLLLSLRDNPLKAIGKAGFVGTALEIL